MTQPATTSPDWCEAAYLYSTEALFVADAGGTLSHWSESFGRMVGRVVARETTLSQLFHQDEREALAAAWARLRETTDPLEVHGRLLTAENVYVSLACVLRRAPHGVAVYGSLRPAPGRDRPAADDAKKGAPKDMLRVLSENLPIIIWAIDQDGVFTHYDGKGAEAFGFVPGQLVGENVFDFFASVPKEVENVRRALGGSSIHELNNTAINNTFWETWMVPTRNSLGVVEAVIRLSLDVSEVKRAEAELGIRLMQIQKQQEVIGKLSTPIIQVWEGVLVLPMIGVVDSKRTSDVMQKVLDEVVRTGAQFAILDLTGVEMVDTQVANHIIKLVSAIRLLGAGGIICGIRPSVAQIMVGLGLDLTTIVTRANLKAGLMFCMNQMRRLEAAAPQPAR